MVDGYEDCLVTQEPNRQSHLSIQFVSFITIYEQEAKGIWQRLHRMTSRTRHAA